MEHVHYTRLRPASPSTLLLAALASQGTLQFVIIKPILAALTNDHDAFTAGCMYPYHHYCPPILLLTLRPACLGHAAVRDHQAHLGGADDDAVCAGRAGGRQLEPLQRVGSTQSVCRQYVGRT